MQDKCEVFSPLEFGLVTFAGALAFPSGLQCQGVSGWFLCMKKLFVLGFLCFQSPV